MKDKVKLILAAVTIGTLESSGVIGKAKIAGTETANAEGNETATQDRYLSYIEDNDPTPKPITEDLSSSTSYVG